MSNLLNTSNILLIIANGSSALNYQYGKEINQFSNIARINNYSIEKYEKYVGNKTDIWFNGANQGLKKRIDKPDRIVVFIPAEILSRKGDAIHQRIEKRLGTQRSNYELISNNKMLKYEKQIGVTRPTTGTSSIMWGLDNFDKVVIHGFDFFIDSQTHYNENRLTRWLIEKNIVKKATKHNMDGEKKYIESLLLTKKVVLLKDYLK
ncbi:MAG: hypothetical protein HN952_01095 [Candidatus Cloacimonetes bacterium]|jgi:hypothetical protein|nr:hypothetical protein [Candidatus Cloacimonadota bacterium]MBT6993530.1 hypothetical protein [Candidatus Cloacimonadota bacterium]MBT7469442.1 hypothetical protein [Candidatus Cloacimonadota bacterium]